MCDNGKATYIVAGQAKAAHEAQILSWTLKSQNTSFAHISNAIRAHREIDCAFALLIPNIRRSRQRHVF